jgi:hypothetical protein
MQWCKVWLDEVLRISIQLVGILGQWISSFKRLILLCLRHIPAGEVVPPTKSTDTYMGVLLLLNQLPLLNLLMKISYPTMIIINIKKRAVS